MDDPRASCSGSPVRGRPHKWEMREIVNAIFYVLRGGVTWSLLPREFPPKSTVFHWFSVFRDTCLLEKINHALVRPGNPSHRRPARSAHHSPR